jgi:hypothetical protein
MATVPPYRGISGTGQVPAYAPTPQQMNQQAPNFGGNYQAPTPQNQQPQQKGQQSYNPTQSPYGMDQTQQGVGEQYWSNNQQKWGNSPQMDWASSQLPKFEQPGFGEAFNQKNIKQFGKAGQGQQFWNQVQGKFNTQGQYGGPNLAAESYNRTVGAIPGSLQPTFDKAFDRAKETAVGDANSQAAARGAYGSSQALNNVGNVITDIEAKRADRASQFALQDSQNQAAWQGLAGQQGRAADQSEMGGFGTNLQGIQSFGDMAFNAENQDLNRDRFASGVGFGIQDQGFSRVGQGINAAMNLDSADLNRTNSGFQASMGAQDQRDGRIQGAFDNTRNMQNDLTGFFGGQYDQLFGADYAAQQDAMNAGLGLTAEARNQGYRDQERMRQAGSDAIGAYTGITQAQEAAKKR